MRTGYGTGNGQRRKRYILLRFTYSLLEDRMLEPAFCAVLGVQYLIEFILIEFAPTKRYTIRCPHANQKAKTHLTSRTTMKSTLSVSSSVTTPPPLSMAVRTFAHFASPSRQKWYPAKSVVIVIAESSITGRWGAPLPSASSGPRGATVAVRLNGWRVIGSFGSGTKELVRLNDEMTLCFPSGSLSFSLPFARTSGMSRAGNRVGDVGGPARDCDFEGLRTSLFPPASSSKPLGRKRFPQSCNVTARTGACARDAGSSSSAWSSSRPGLGGNGVLGRCPSTGIAFEGFVPGAESRTGIEVAASIMRELISNS